MSRTRPPHRHRVTGETPLTFIRDRSLIRMEMKTRHNIKLKLLFLKYKESKQVFTPRLLSHRPY